MVVSLPLQEGEEEEGEGRVVKVGKGKVVERIFPRPHL